MNKEYKQAIPRGRNINHQWIYEKILKHISNQGMQERTPLNHLETENTKEKKQQSMERTCIEEELQITNQHMNKYSNQFLIKKNHKILFFMANILKLNNTKFG